MSQQTLLLTGFEPFDQWDVNPSWEAARTLDLSAVGEAAIASRMLPVDWERSWPVLQRAMEETTPRWIVMLGLAANRRAISVESVANNVCADRSDNTGKPPVRTLITPDGEGELAVTLPVEEIISALTGMGMLVERSSDAGGYLCNYTLYKALEWAKSQADAPPTGFIHLPGLPGTDPDLPGMALDDMTRAIRAALVITVNASRTHA